MSDVYDPGDVYKYQIIWYRGQTKYMLQIDFFVLLAQIVNFCILGYVFKVFIADTLHQKLEQRKQQLKTLALAQQEYDSRVALAQQHKQELLKQAQQTTMILREQSEKIAQEKAQKIIAKAKLDARRVLDGGKRELEKEKKYMLAHVKNHIINTSLKLNEKIFHSWQTNKEFLEKELENIK